MSNQIRLKRASGSDPGASDLVLGEPAVRTDTGEIFLKKDDGSIAKVAGGIDDGDKGDITVSNDGGTFTIDNDAVTYAKIQNVSATNRILGRDSSGAGVIEEITPANLRTMINVENGATADQSASEILTLLKTVDGAGSGLDADTLDGISSASFVRSDANDTMTGNLTISNTHPQIFFTDTNNNSDFKIQNLNGVFGVRDETNSATRLSIASDGTTTIAQNLDVGAGVDVTGNITVSGTVDGRDLATDGSKLDGIAASATNVTNTNQLTNGAGYITATLTEEQVEDFVGGMVTGNTETGITVTYQDSDGTLDFVVASQTDNNFTNADHSKLDGIESGATADQTASEILTLLKTVDGSGSGLDADLLDGANPSVSASNNTIVKRHSSGYIFANYFNTTPNTVSSGVTQVCVETGNDGYIRHGTAAAIRTFINVADGATNVSNNNQLTNGAGYITSADGGNAATLDSLDSTAFLRSNATDSASGDLTFTGEMTMNVASISNGILEVKATIASSRSLTSGYNAMAVSPTINSGVTVTVPSGAVWAIV